MGVPGNKRKIIFTVINDLTYDQRMNRICTSLAGAGYEVLLVGRTLPGSQPLKTRSYGQKRLRCFFNKGKLFYAEYNMRLLFFLLFTSFDIICSIDLDTLVPGYLSGKLKRKPVVFDAHEYFTEVPEVINRPATKRIWEWVANTFIPKVNYCYTVGPILAELFSKKYGAKFETIMNAPVTKPLPPVDRQPNVLLYQGALNKGRGIENYIDMMPMLPGFQLWIVGEGDLSSALRARVKEKNVTEQVKFTGKIEPEKLFETTCAAFIGLNVSENIGMSYYYSLNNKFFDHIHAVL
ncbi:MAG TPA: glycosyltransferase, partial [Bacteroidia bacterium]|nr:glycosyltransferase [Bacteroidia bacterium]